jgi:hypothetical protein
MALAGCGNSNSYWYCWNTGDPSPHHLGHPVSGDHLCSDSELKAAGIGGSSAKEAAAAGGDSFTPPAPQGGGFCSTHTCIPNFDNGTGAIVQCQDGEWSHSGGEPGACSHHGGEAFPVSNVKLPKATPTPTIPTPPTPRAPASHPTLVGPASASSGSYSVRIRSVRAAHTLDISEGPGPPTFGVGLMISCSEPSTYQVVTWKVTSGHGLADQTTQD